MSSGTTIVVAHEKAAQRRRLCHILERAGYEVVTAVDGAEAARFVGGLEPEAVLAGAALDGIAQLCRVPDLAGRLVLVADEADGRGPDDGIPVVVLAGLSAQQLLQRLAVLLLCRRTGSEPTADLASASGDLGGLGLGELLHQTRRHRLTGRIALDTARGAGVWLARGNVVDAWWGALRGDKAFCRLAMVREARWRLELEARPPRATLDGPLESLVDRALEECLHLEEQLRRLPSLAARVELGWLGGAAARGLDPVESAVLRHALTAATFSDLLDMPGASDSEVARAVGSLCRRRLLSLTD